MHHSNAASTFARRGVDYEFAAPSSGLSFGREDGHCRGDENVLQFVHAIGALGRPQQLTIAAEVSEESRQGGILGVNANLEETKLHAHR